MEILVSKANPCHTVRVLFHLHMLGPQSGPWLTSVPITYSSPSSPVPRLSENGADYHYTCHSMLLFVLLTKLHASKGILLVF